MGRGLVSQFLCDITSCCLLSYSGTIGLHYPVDYHIRNSCFEQYAEREGDEDSVIYPEIEPRSPKGMGPGLGLQHIRIPLSQNSCYNIGPLILERQLFAGIFF